LKSLKRPFCHPQKKGSEALRGKKKKKKPESKENNNNNNNRGAEAEQHPQTGAEIERRRR
jgi:hypothetical protein